METLDFTAVDYWDELCAIMRWSLTHVYSTLHICWGAQAGLFYHHHVPKYALNEKLSGIFKHRPLDMNHPLLRGFDEMFYMPHSRYTEVRQDDMDRNENLQVLALSETAGVGIAATGTRGRCSSRDTASTIDTPWLESTIGTASGASPRGFPRTISRRTIRRRFRPCCGEGTPACFSPTG